MIVQNEFEAYDFLKDVIKNVLLDNEQFIENPEDTFTLFKGDESTPAIVLELNDTVAIENAVNGQMSRGETNFTIALYIGKLNRPYSKYKVEIIGLLGRLQNAFSSNGQRIVWKSVEFGDYALENGNITGASISIAVPIGNYAYEIST